MILWGIIIGIFIGTAIGFVLGGSLGANKAEDAYLQGQIDAQERGV